MNRNQSRRQGTEVPGEHLLCSNVAAGVYRFFFQMQVIVVRSNAAREAELNCTVSKSFYPILLLQVILESPSSFH